MKIRQSFGIGLLVTLALVGSGCGGKKKSPDTTSAAAPVDSASPTESPATAPPETGAASAPAAFKTKTAGTLTVCSDIPYAPFEYYENGADGPVIGIDAEIVSAAAQGLGLKTEFRKTPFDGIFAALAASQCDIIASSVSITEDRKKSNDFTDGYFTIHQSILVRSEDATLNDLSALEGRVVGVQTATTGADFAKKDAKADGYDVKEFAGADDLIVALKAKQVDAVVQDSPINGYAATKSDGALVVSKVFEGGGEAYGFVVPKDNPDLTAALNGTLTTMKSDGRYKTILTKYLGDTAGVA